MNRGRSTRADPSRRIFETVAHFSSYLTDDETRRVLVSHQRDIARFIHSQMLPHYGEDGTSYEVRVSAGFTGLKDSAYTANTFEPALDYRLADNMTLLGLAG